MMMGQNFPEIAISCVDQRAFLIWGFFYVLQRVQSKHAENKMTQYAHIFSTSSSSNNEASTAKPVKAAEETMSWALYVFLFEARVI